MEQPTTIVPTEWLNDVSRILKTLSPIDAYMTLDEAATYIRRSPDYLRKRKTKIGFHKEGKDLTFKKSDLDKYMNSIYHRSSERGHIERKKVGGTQKRDAAY